jgi:hypothetical protein
MLSNSVRDDERMHEILGTTTMLRYYKYYHGTGFGKASTAEARKFRCHFNPKQAYNQLGRRPSTLVLDHACVCIANGKKPLRPTARPLSGGLLQKGFQRHFLFVHQKHVKGRDITSGRTGGEGSGVRPPPPPPLLAHQSPHHKHCPAPPITPPPSYAPRAVFAPFTFLHRSRLRITCLRLLYIQSRHR